MKRIHLLLTIALIVSLTSCDCVIKVSGVVLDSKTKLPLEGVEPRLEKPDTTSVYDQYRQLSDESGKFEYSKISGVCKSVELYFNKKGYKIEKIELKNA